MDTLDDLPLDLEFRFLLKFGEWKGQRFIHMFMRACVLEHSKYFTVSEYVYTPDNPTANSQTSSQGV